jgi:glycine cleavage system transcriptional repressor
MTKHVAISVLGKDRPGIVADITKILFETGCNIEDSSMTLLRSEFAMIVLVALGKTATQATLEKRFNALSAKAGLAVFIKPISTKEDTPEILSGTPCMIAVYGADKPGIVYKVSDFCSKKKINITDVQTTISNRAKTYTMLLEVRLPRSPKVPAIRTALATLSKKLDVTITIQPTETPEL